MEDQVFRALVSEETPEGIRPSVKERKISDLPDGDVLIRVLYSSLNYKDALSSHGNRGITRNFPHTPGIDSCGIVESSRVDEFKPGQQVLVCSYDLGMNTSGGFGQYIRVPAEWVMPLPEGLTPEESMMLGTAGFTAALALYQMEVNGQKPSSGPILVTGATGGLGSLAVNILSGAGYELIASTGKAEQAEYLKSLGASQILSREETDDQSGKYLLRPRWAGAIDTVGGNILATAVKGCMRHGNVACCGNANSIHLNTTVFPFIINGINLLGIESATWPMHSRKAIWQKLAKDWKPGALHSIASMITLDDLPQKIELILQGKVRGRYFINLR